MSGMLDFRDAERYFAVMRQALPDDGVLPGAFNGEPLGGIFPVHGEVLSAVL